MSDCTSYFEPHWSYSPGAVPQENRFTGVSHDVINQILAIQHAAERDDTEDVVRKGQEIDPTYHFPVTPENYEAVRTLEALLRLAKRTAEDPSSAVTTDYKGIRMAMEAIIEKCDPVAAMREGRLS